VSFPKHDSIIKACNIYVYANRLYKQPGKLRLERAKQRDREENYNI